MACFHPLKAWRSSFLKENGRKDIIINSGMDNFPGYDRISLPCGKCKGCRLERSRQWAVRIMHEASLHDVTKGGRGNCFITLTFNEESIAKRGHHSVDVRDYQLFMKRLRKKFGNGIRFYHCGEYGDQYGRPHYHAILFNHSFDDRYPWKRHNGSLLYRSDSLEKLWPYGYSSVGDVTFNSAAYVARYVMKKWNGPQADSHYTRISNDIDHSTGEVFKVLPEYNTMSRRPGIAKDWYLANKDEVFPSDSVVVNGKEVRPPKYYTSLYEHEYPEDYAKLKAKREIAADAFRVKNPNEDSDLRLHVKEVCTTRRVDLLKRGFSD